MRIIF